MTESALCGVASNTTLSTASTTWYGPLDATGPQVQLETTEAAAQVKVRGACTFRRLRVSVSTHSRSTTSTVTLRVAGADSALTVAATAGATGVLTDLTNSVDVADGTFVCLAITNGSGTGNFTPVSVTLERVTSGQSYSRQTTFGSTSFTAQRFYNLAGTIAAASSESVVLSRALEACTLSNLQAYVRANASTGFTIKSRKAGADGAQSISVGSAQTGFFEDTSNSDSLAQNDSYCVVTTAPSASVTLGMLSMKYTSGVAGRSAVSAGGVSANLASGNIRYSALHGPMMVSATESLLQQPMPFAGSLSGLGCNVNSNASSAQTTLVSRINGSSGTLSVAITASTTGFFQDLAHTDSFSAGDLVCTQASGSNGTVAFSWIGALVNGPVVNAAAGGGLMLLGAG